ncbi:hypothetical protein VU04_09670 [Desulfobulbus sp. TB]|nr:hypothetical protein [Desulfobulbus sp. TB]
MYVRTKKVLIFGTISLLIGITAQANVAERKVKVTEKSFECLHQNQKVRNMYIDNILGNLKETLAVAESGMGGVYPPGTVLQLIPGEAMVKLDKGANPETNDWEFFILDVNKDGAKIKARGFAEMKSALGGSCLACHSKAKPQWDMTCEQGHGCGPIVLSGFNVPLLTSAMQKTDLRCDSPESLTPEEDMELKKLLEMLAKKAAENGQVFEQDAPAANTTPDTCGGY